MKKVLRRLHFSHKYKTGLFKFLNVLPNSLGYFLYHRLQMLFEKKDLHYKIESIRTSYRVIERILKSQNIRLENTRCIELGSGWLPILPYILKLESGVSQVDTYDLKEHFNKRKISGLNDHFMHEITKNELRFNGKYNLLEGINYFPNTDIKTADFTQVRLLFSRFVLEHIPPEEIASMHDAFHENMDSHCYILHLISPSDHRSYSDKSISKYDFLKYSKEEWDKIQTKFDYHNRLRLPQFLDILEKKFDVIYLNYDSCSEDSEEFNKFKELVIHSDFHGMRLEELTAGSIQILLKKKE